jgi:6-phosphogluconolactonase (cycloisomerase 2 family)
VLGAAALLLASAAPTVYAGSNDAVYAITNSASGNAVVAWSRAATGALAPLGTFATGGSGTGAGLGSQGAVTVDGSGRWLLAVNAGSNDVSAFAIRPDGTLSLTDRIASGGTTPISVTVHQRVAYVLNAGGAGNISGLRLDRSGDLTAIAGSTRALGSAAPQAAEVAFSPRGDQLVVTEKATNTITSYHVNAGLAGTPQTRSSAGATPFGFDFDQRGRVIASEAAGGAANASTVSSYRIGSTGAQVIDGPVATTETAACWVVVTDGSRYAYAANTGSGTVSGFSIAPNGDLTLLDADGVTGTTGGAPADEAIGGQFLYVRVGGLNRVSGFRIGHDGSLAPIGSVSVPAGLVGLAAG